MFLRRPFSACIASCILSTCAAALTSAAARPAPAKKESAARKPNTNATKQSDPIAQFAKADKAKRADKERQRRIVAYNLYGDPDFKLRGALSDKRYFVTPNRPSSLGTGLGYSVTGSLASRQAGFPSTATGLHADGTDGAGIAFNCHEKIVNTVPGKRQLSACYQLEVDKSWKTQTFVSSRRRSDGSQNWGGGVLLGYAY